MKTKELILKEGEKVFSEKGYYKTRMDDIAKSAKIAKGTIYIYFKSKKDLFVSIIENSLKEFLERIKRVSEREKDEVDKLENMIKEMLNEHMSKKIFLRKVDIHRLMEDKELRREFKKRIAPLFREVIGYSTRIIREGIRNGKIRGKNPEIISAFILGGIRSVSFIHEFIYGEVEINKEEVEKEILEVIEKGILLHPKNKKEVL